MIAVAAVAVVASAAVLASIAALYIALTVDQLPHGATVSARVVWYHGRVLALLGLLIVDLAILSLLLWGVAGLAMQIGRVFGAH